MKTIRQYAQITLAVAMVLSVAAGPAVAQPQPPHKVYGTVTDQNGDAVSSETVTVTYDGSQIASTTTDSNGDYEVQMSDPDSETSSESLTIEVKDSTKSTTWESAKSERVDFSVTVSTGGDDGSDDDGGGGGGGGGISPEEEEQEEQDDQEEQGDQDQEESPTVEQVREELDQTEPNTETQTEIVDTDPNRPGININPEGTESVKEVTINNEEATGTVEIREWQDPSETVDQSVSAAAIENAEEVLADDETSSDDGESGSSDGETGGDDGASGSDEETETTVSADVKTVADIEPDSDDARGSSATVTMTVERDRVDNPENLVIVHERGDSWEDLDTTVEETSEEEVSLTAETESFSLFAVAEVTETTRQVESDDTTSEEPEEDGGLGTTGLIGLVVVLALIVAGAIGYRQMNNGGGNEF